MNHWVCVRRDYRVSEERDVAARARARVLESAARARCCPFIILGGIHLGVFTPTEASAVAVFYALVAGSSSTARSRFDKLPAILFRTAMMTASVLLIVAMSNVFAWVLTVLQIPQAVGELDRGLRLAPGRCCCSPSTSSCSSFGIFIEPLPGVMIFVPILAPLADAVGINPCTSRSS